MRIWYLVGFGLAGLFSRYFLGWFASRIGPGEVPVGTFFINMVGAFLIGAVYAWAQARGVSENIRIGLTVGFLGSFTTFSALTLESFRLFESGKLAWAAIYLLGSPILGAGLTAAAAILTRRALVP